MLSLPIQLLLVEDDPGDALLVESLLSGVAPNVDVMRVGRLQEAEEMLSSPPGIDCVLLDLGLPDAMGLEGVERLRAAAPDAAIVVLTGYDDEQRGIDALSRGAEDYLAKGRIDGPLLARAIRYAIERCRADRSQRELIEARLHARENARLERGLLPQALLRDPRIALSTTYRPGRRRSLLGGDFYDAVELDDGTLHVLIGDVSGHGPDEAALGACLRVAWRTLMLAQRPPDEALPLLQEVLRHERHAPAIFATLCMLSVAPDRGTAELRVAGHPPPVVVDRDGLRTVAVVHVSPPLGFVEPGGWRGNALRFEGDWALLLYTDGLIDGRIGEGSERLGEQRLVELLERRVDGDVGRLVDASPLLDELVTEVERLHGGDLTDDVAMVVVVARRDG
ncbi:MAG TPA: fused response regulator/phosphatase [Conexibacter sp.]|jgi:serine phosphatase RsbU (regulator of sigma subunit)|nr:fused response regulator/phosphatase [Conexibacter sp.]